MKKEINFGIGFVTGRSNICNVINSYYLNMIEQVKLLDYHVKITLYILYDLNYRGATKEDFYKIDPEVFNYMNIRFITPEDVILDKEKIVKGHNITNEEANLFLGTGHARGRNTIMYNAYKDRMDYLLFWDDDEYPIANIKKDNKIIWKKQSNINMHLNNIKNADITIGYHCGYISPIPYFDLKNKKFESHFKDFIESVSNDIISWTSIKEKIVEGEGITYAEEDIANGKNILEIKKKDGGKWVAGSTLCINLNNIDNIPAFYNPINARGEDTFFSTKLDNAKVLKVPVYHFHDGFLLHTDIMQGKYPKMLKKADNSDIIIEKRFFQATIGWIRYKPLLMYIKDKENYKWSIIEVRKKLENSINTMNSFFKGYDFNEILQELDHYSNNVENDYNEYILTNEIWKKLKMEK